MVIKLVSGHLFRKDLMRVKVPHLDGTLRNLSYRVIMKYHKFVINMNIYLMYKAKYGLLQGHLCKYVINVGDYVDIYMSNVFKFIKIIILIHFSVFYIVPNKQTTAFS